MSLRSLIVISLFAALVAVPAAASAPQPSEPDRTVDTAKDISELPAFVASRPTPEEFQQAFPEIWLVLPGDIVSRSVCSEYFRFMAELDAEGRISGGSLE